MFNVTGGELVIIFLAALVILGPERLPEAARTVGRFMAQVRDVSQGFQKELKSAMDEVGEPIQSLRPHLTALDGGARPAATDKPKSAEMYDPTSGPDAGTAAPAGAGAHPATAAVTDDPAAVGAAIAAVPSVAGVTGVDATAAGAGWATPPRPVLPEEPTPHPGSSEERDRALRATAAAAPPFAPGADPAPGSAPAGPRPASSADPAPNDEGEHGEGDGGQAVGPGGRS